MTSITHGTSGTLRITRDSDLTVGSHPALLQAEPGEQMHVVTFEHHDGGPYTDVHRPGRDQAYCAGYCQHLDTAHVRTSEDTEGAWMRSTFRGTHTVTQATADEFALDGQAAL